ncbi:hypothetical protein TIFTF001_038069 [Ficus carica]|uniref:Uncharacterized protein n=1 Tax=Ficus carica TaxID=3494 RepID=A0AA88E7E5_FICCA|nr:hypothetical protein TIFTF001_038069 [Ficus carica]
MTILSGYSRSSWKGTRSSTGCARISSSGIQGSRSLRRLTPSVGASTSSTVKTAAIVTGAEAFQHTLLTASM